MLEVFSSKYTYDSVCIPPTCTTKYPLLLCLVPLTFSLQIRLDIKSGKVRARTTNDTSVVVSYPLSITTTNSCVYVACCDVLSLVIQKSNLQEQQYIL